MSQSSQHNHSVHIRLDHLRNNYRFLCRAAKPARGSTFSPAVLPPCPGRNDALGHERELLWPEIIPVIKADAYGHGHIRIAELLLEEGVTLFASGSVSEAAALRDGLLAVGAGTPAIISLLGPMEEGDVRLASESGIIVTIHGFSQLEALEKTGMPLAVAVKCNTGMARLGFEPEDIPVLLRRLGAMPYIIPVLALSHLASADCEQGEEEARGQAEAFVGMLEVLRDCYPSLAASLANTAGTLLSASIEKVMGPQICRPGFGLYGGNPFTGTSLEALGAGLTPAMSVSTPLIAVHGLRRGKGIGYGHTFRAEKDMRVGIVAAGYADMFPRFMSGHGEMCICGGRAPVLGRVSMQMTAVDLERCPDARPGDTVWLLGGPYAEALGVEELASLWNSIAYEVFCLLGNGRRRYTTRG